MQMLFPLHSIPLRAVAISSRLTGALKSFKTNYPYGRKKRPSCRWRRIVRSLRRSRGEIRTSGETKVRIKDSACRLRD